MLPPDAVSVSDHSDRTTRIADALRNLQHAVAQCSDVVFVADSTGIITRVNEAFQKLSGYTALDVVGRDLSTMTDGGPAGENYQNIWRRLFEEKTYTGTWRLRAKDGTTYPLDVRIAAVGGGRRKVVSLVGTGHTIAQSAPTKPAIGHLSPAPECARLAHDVRNLMMLVVARADLAGEALPSAASVSRHLDEIKTAARNTAAILQHCATTDTALAQDRQQISETLADCRKASTPLSKASAISIASDRASQEKCGRGGTILLVDDEPLIRESMAEFLVTAGYEVVTAADGQEALQQLTLHEDVDLLITDVALPGMDGTQLAEAVRSIRPTTKLLMISGYPDLGLFPTKESRTQGFLAKPFSLTVLRDKVQALVGGRESARGAAAGA